MPIASSLVERFAALFTGYQKFYGTYEVKGVEEGGKVKGRAKTIQAPPTVELYAKHLEGIAGLGIIMLREDDTVCFGAIDYDVRTMDHIKAEAMLRAQKLPLLLCRSKSGGGHFYCFTTEPVPAEQMRERLEEWKALLGMSAKTEVFPKQSSRFSEDDIGSWINLPYFDADNTVRYAILDGKAVGLAQFLDAAEACRVSPETIATPTIAANAESLFVEGPPCLVMLEKMGGFPEGTRNDGMTAVAVYLKKRFPDDWKQRIDEYNQVMAKLPSSEIQNIVKTHTRKDYPYRCSTAPINAYCQRRRCRAQPFGVGEVALDVGTLEITGITKYVSPDKEDAQWAMDINGKRVMMSTADLYSKERFNHITLNAINRIAIHGSPAKWHQHIDKMLTEADVVELPAEASTTGNLWTWIDRFCLDQVSAQDIEIGRAHV